MKVKISPQLLLATHRFLSTGTTTAGVSEGLAMRWRCFLKFFSGFCSIRGGAVQTGSHLREDPAETDQTPQRGPGPEV